MDGEDGDQEDGPEDTSNNLSQEPVIMEIPADGIVPLQGNTQEDGDGEELKVKVKEPSKKDGKMMKTFQKDGVKKRTKQGQKAGKKKPGANISYWLPWWNSMEREAEKSREELKKNRISKYLKPMKPTSCLRVVCSSENIVNVAREHHSGDEKSRKFIQL